MSVGLLQVDTLLRPSGYARSYGGWRQFVLCVLCLVWFLPGITGRLPWKPVEAVMVPAVAETAVNGDFVAPTLLGEPFLGLATVPALLAAASAELLDGLIPDHEGMRFANIVWLVLGLGLSGLVLGRRHGSRVGWRAVLLMAGSPALLLHARTVNPDLALLALASCGMAGMLIRRERPLQGTVMLGLTAMIGVWCAGTVALWFIALLAASPLIGRGQERHSASGAGAVFIFCLVGLGLWLSALGAEDPELPALVGLSQLSALGLGEMLISLQKVIGTAAWALWPALPLAALAVVRRRSERTDDLRLGIAMVAAGVLALLFTGVPEESRIFLLLPGVALMAATNLSGLSREIAKALDWFAILVIGSGLIGLFWITWLLAQTDAAPALGTWLASQGIERPVFSWSALIALLATLAWVGMMLRIGRSPERSVLNWMSGATMGWLVFSLLWLPSVDAAKGYAAPAAELRDAAQDLPCVQAEGLSRTVVAQLEYFSGLRLAGDADCGFRLLPGGAAGEGELLWSGGRPGDRLDERLALVAVLGDN